MSFFLARDGALYRADNVASLRKKTAPGSGWVATMVDGDEIAIASATARAIRNAAAPIIPAQPGIDLVQFCAASHCQPPFVWRRPVIAWRVDDEFGGLVPVVADPDVVGTEADFAVIYPDGRVENAMGEQHATESEWFEEQCRNNARRQGGGAC